MRVCMRSVCPALTLAGSYLERMAFKVQPFRLEPYFVYPQAASTRRSLECARSEQGWQLNPIQSSRNDLFIGRVATQLSHPELDFDLSRYPWLTATLRPNCMLYSLAYVPSRCSSSSCVPCSSM